MPYVRKGKNLTTEETKNLVLKWAKEELRNPTNICTKLHKEYQEKIARWTVKKWCAEAGIPLVNRLKLGSTAKEEEFIRLIKEGFILKDAKEKAKIGMSAAQKILDKHNLRRLTRDRAAVAKTKRLSDEKKQKRLPPEYICIGYNENTKKYIIKAPDGYVYEKSVTKSNWRDPRENERWNLETLKEEFKKMGYTYKNGYTTSTRVSMTATHDICGKDRTTNLDHFKKWGCGTCNNKGTSGKEEALRTWVESLVGSTTKYKFKNSKTKPKEIDIFIPTLNVGIEFNGLYWHSGDNFDKKTHYNKMIESNKEGIRLITIFEDEWTCRQKQVKGFLKSILQKNEHILNGRDCTIKQIDKATANIFYENNHIQGKVSSVDLAMGLFSKDLLVGVISFGKHHRGMDCIVLNRLCFLENYSIRGGSSKLLKKSINWLKTNTKYDTMISWSDNRWSEGNVYKTLGFTLEDELPPDYSYTTGNAKRFSKQSCQKKHLLKKGATGNTESEMAESIGYKKIWDCGKKRWILKF